MVSLKSPNPRDIDSFLYIYGRPPSITPMMLDALCDHLAEKPGFMSNR
jgi:hypothetical protein